MNFADRHNTPIISPYERRYTFQKKLGQMPNSVAILFSLKVMISVSLLFWIAASQAVATITPVANTGMTLPVSNGENFTGFGKEPSQDQRTPGNVVFTATGSIPQLPGSAAVVLIYSSTQPGFVTPPVAETDVPVSGIHFVWFGSRLSFRNGRVAFLGGTIASTQGKANGLYSATSPGIVSGIMGGSYFSGVVPYNGIVNGAVETKVQSAFTPSFDSNDPNPDLYWTSFSSDFEQVNAALHSGQIIKPYTPFLYLAKNATTQLQINNLLPAVTLHADGGNVALSGGPGISVLVGGSLKTVASNITPDPSAATQPPGKQTFTGLAVPSGIDASPGFQKSYITFWGINSFSGISGIYFQDLGDMMHINPATAPLLVADTSMPIPGFPSKTFTSFDYQTCIDGSQIAFIGSKPNPGGSATPYDVKGIYVSQIVGGKPSTTMKVVVDLTTPLDFGNGVIHTPTDLSIGHEACAGGQIVFWAQYDATHSGIFLATIPSTIEPPTVTVQATDPTASTLGDPGTFVISRTGDTSSSLSVNYATNGTAANGTAYQSLSGTVTIASGASSVSLTVTPIDGCGQGDKTAILSLNANPSYSVGSPGSATITIQDTCNNVSPDTIITNYINHLAFVPSSTTVQAQYNDQDFGLVIASTTVGGSDAGGFKNITAGLQVPPGYDIVGVRVCYVKLADNTFINRIRIAQMQNPPSGYVVRLDDVVSLTSPGPICHDSASTLIDPRGGVPQLYLGVTFSNTTDRIIIRGVALELKKHIGP